MSDPFKLCILRLSAIGDVCHAVAMVTAIQQQRPNVQITWVIGKIEHQLVSHMSNIRFVVYDKLKGKQANNEVRQALQDTLFDSLFVMQVALRANLLSRVINAKQRVGFDRKRSKEGHSFFVNKRIAPRAHAHVLDGFMGFAETLGVSVLDKPKWNLSPPAKDKHWVDTKLSNKFAVISPAASKVERNWLPERYAEIAHYLTQQGLEVVLCGGPGELDTTTAEAILANTNSVTHNLVGKTSLTQLLAVLGKAELVIAPDTGPAHMATTQGTPVIGLYAHSNPRRTGPYNSLHTSASAYEKCIQKQYGKPWQDLPWGKRAKGKDLMSEISVQEVKSLIQKVLRFI